MRKVDVFVGGSVGSAPYAPGTWSGSSAALLYAMSGIDLLGQAVGVKLTRAQNAWFQAKNFARSRAVWRQQFYLDPIYRDALTQAAKSMIQDQNVCLQYGAMFSLPQAFPSRLCVSYQDGNLAQTIQGGFNLQGVSRQSIDRALRYEENVAQQMAAVLTFSEYLRQSFISDYHVPAERVFNIGGGVNLDVPSSQPEKDYRGLRLLFVGVEFERKGGPVLLEALKLVQEKFPAAELHIVGPAQRPSSPAGVTFHGRLSKSDPEQRAKLERLFKQATLFVLPSLYEPFGIAPLEAMLYQVPCILTNDWAFPEFVTSGVTGELTDKGSAEDVAAKIIGLLSQPERLTMMGFRAREKVLNHYCWGGVALRMSAVVEGLQ